MTFLSQRTRTLTKERDKYVYARNYCIVYVCAQLVQDNSAVIIPLELMVPP